MAVISPSETDFDDDMEKGNRQVIADLESDTQALVALYASTEGEGWSEQQSWLDEAEDVMGGLENAEDGEYIRSLLDTKVLYGSWCCSRTNFHHPGATAFFNRPAKLPVGKAATQARLSRGW